MHSLATKLRMLLNELCIAIELLEVFVVERDTWTLDLAMSRSLLNRFR